MTARITPDSSSTATGERATLQAVAELVGRLLLKEVDAELLEQMADPKLAEVFNDMGVDFPTSANESSWLEERGADYHDLFLRPETGPLVQSLWTQGRYEGDSTVRVRQLAQTAGVEFQRAAARGAAPDHLGCLLLLWARTDGRVQVVADELTGAHLRWAEIPLQRIQTSGGFYGAVATLALTLIVALDT